MVTNRLHSFRGLPSSFNLLLVVIDTTAHSLAATLGMLALNNDVQDEIFQHIISVIGYDHDPVCALAAIIIVVRYGCGFSHSSKFFIGFRRLPKT